MPECVGKQGSGMFARSCEWKDWSVKKEKGKEWVCERLKCKWLCVIIRRI